MSSRFLRGFLGDEAKDRINYSGTSGKRPFKMSSLGSRLRELDHIESKLILVACGNCTDLRKG